MKKLRNFFYKIKYTMRFSILTIFITLFVIAIITLTLVIFLRFHQAISRVSFQFMEEASTDLYNKVETEFHDIAVSIELFDYVVRKKIIDDSNVKELIDYMTLLIKVDTKIIPSLQGIYFADETGSFFMVRKSQNGGTETEIINRRQKPYQHTFIYTDEKNKILKLIDSNDFNYDPRVRPWYILAKKEGRFAWTDLYAYHLTGDLGITGAKPVLTQKGKIIGIIAFNLRLDYIRHFIESMQISPNGIVYVVTLHGKVIAFPHISQYQTGRLIDIQNLKFPYVIASFEEYKKHFHKKFIFRHDGKNYLAVYNPFPHLGHDKQWLIGMVAPETDFISELLKTNLIILLTSIIILLTGIYFMSKLVNRIVNPLKRVVDETNKIKNFELEGNLQPVESRINEIDALSQAIFRMKLGLRSFEKYVPANLVRQLIESGRDVKIGGEKKRLAILFSDIKNFTSISENMDPDELMKYICEYFNEASLIIAHESGTIDKYIGDSIMAFWGAPLAENKSCYHAALAALRFEKRTTELNHKWVSEGKPPLFTRIGLHYGEAIVGNLGSAERLNYTALGDVINTTSRLENINKLYLTKIIVSEAFYREISSHFVCRFLDFIALKGRAHGIYIYELLAESLDEITFNFSAYQDTFMQGFAAYQAKNWDLAISYFAACLEIYPADSVASLFIKRCQNFKMNPPAQDWDGIWRM